MCSIYAPKRPTKCCSHVPWLNFVLLCYKLKTRLTYARIEELMPKLITHTHTHTHIILSWQAVAMNMQRDGGGAAAEFPPFRIWICLEQGKHMSASRSVSRFTYMDRIYIIYERQTIRSRWSYISTQRAYMYVIWCATLSRHMCHAWCRARINRAESV